VVRADCQWQPLHSTLKKGVHKAMDEQELIEKSQSGDIEAFGMLISLYEKKIYNLAYRISGNSEDAFDISQETFIKIFKSIQHFKGESSFSTWIYRIATNTAYDYLKYEAKPKHSLDDEKNPIEIMDKTASPEQAAESNENLKIVGCAINILSLEFRQVLVLRDIEGYSYEEIANILKLELGTVKSRISRARNNLKKILNDWNFFNSGASKITKGGEPQ
jgi:RNA polymerase sigma-70 factor (ECF subfamily)